MSLRRISDVIIRRNVRLQGAVAGRFLATESTEPKDEIVDITAADEKPVYPDDPRSQEELAKKRNKSRLNPSDRNVLMGVRPYEQSLEWYHDTVRYKKRMLGRYGLKSIDVPAGFAWPTPEEVKDAQEYERVAFPLSIQERWKKLEEAKRIKAEEVQARHAEIAEKLAKMDKWTAELNAKIAKKEAELEAARLRKERLVEEVRKHFGFKISPHDERFKTMLAQKEKEAKKKKKEAKKQAKLEKLTSIAQKMSNDASQGEATESTKPVE
ncbi:large ribosomal subunit protein mL64 [Temnothorax longispinosus]|uniref:large ribosomal subunit protein mL64 n=1 Tax=Temnothorax longispinosus TaxID=300112 RepID=UPI003A9991FA